MASDYFNKTYHPPGTPPGTLVDHIPPETAAPVFHLIDYNPDLFAEQKSAGIEECRHSLQRDTITWVHSQGQISQELLRQIGTLFDIHVLAMEDVLNQGQRPKVEEYESQLFVVLAMPSCDKHCMTMEQVSIVFGRNYVITFHSGPNDPFEPLRQRLRKRGRTRELQADYLLYSIIDLVIDQGFPVLEAFGERIEDIEDELLNNHAEKRILSQIHHLRRELLQLRRNLWPQREVINFFLKAEHTLIEQHTLLFFRDCYDHSVQIIDLIENYREMAADLIDVYMSSSSHRLNEIMRVLTIIATLFIPLTFITGIYGMNFSNPDSPWAMPELHWYYGYPMVLAVMLLLIVGMLFYFKRKGWF